MVGLFEDVYSRYTHQNFPYDDNVDNILIIGYFMLHYKDHFYKWRRRLRFLRWGSYVQIYL